MTFLGINAYHPDAAVALWKDGSVLWAAEEERFNRIKHASGFPELALKQCLKDTQLRVGDIKSVAISKDPKAHLLRKFLFLLKHKPKARLFWDRLRASRSAQLFHRDLIRCLGTEARNLRARFINVEHHRAHIASAYFLSGFSRSAVLSIDGMGDFTSLAWGVGDKNRLRILKRVFFPHSAGFLYTAATQFLGFHNFGDEYKVMGLAGYGKPRFLDIMRRMYYLKSDGTFGLVLKFFAHHRGHAKVHWEGGSPDQDILYSEEWINALGMPRSPHEPVTEREKDLAASTQAALEEIYFHVLNHLYRTTHEENLCLAGGVAFNSVANGKLTISTGFRNVFIQPAAGDAGTAIGAAAYAAHCLYEEKATSIMKQAFLGSNPSDMEIEEALRQRNLTFEKLWDENLCRKVAASIAGGSVVGWYQGRMEFGPRALGNRSILADPRRTDMRQILNERIKHREQFRPFAPVVLDERAREFFEMDGIANSPYMLMVFPVRPDQRQRIPAVTHVDGTARVQTVDKTTNPRLWTLIKAFDELTGIPLLLNTSFNESEPIVCTPSEAIDCFLRTKMDMLVIGNYLLERL